MNRHHARAQARTTEITRTRPAILAGGLTLLALASTGCVRSDRERFVAAFETTISPSEAPPHMVAAFGLDDARPGGDIETALASVDVPD